MIRLYIDWGVMSGMRQSQFPELHDAIVDPDSPFEVFYSPTHIADIAGLNPVLNDNVEADLDFLSKITGNRYLHTMNRVVRCDVVQPRELYADYVESNPLRGANTIQDLLGVGNTGDAHLSGLANLSVDLLDRVKLPDGVGKLPFLFPDQGGRSLLDFSNSFLQMAQRWHNSEDYDRVRKLMEGMLQLTRGTISSASDPFAKVDDALRSQGEAAEYSDIEQRITTALDSSRTTPDWFQKIVFTFINLDMLGFHPDKIRVTDRKAHTFHNTLNDASHAAYASTCHYYVVQDKKAHPKVTATYSRLKVNTVVLKPNAVREQGYADLTHAGYSRKPETAQGLFDSVLGSLKGLKPTFEEVNDGTLTLAAYRLPCLYYGFFNKVFVDTSDNAIRLVLSREQPTNWQYFTLKHLIPLANQLMVVLGPADGGIAQFGDDGLEPIRQNPHGQWHLTWGQYSVVLVYHDARVQFYFPAVPLGDGSGAEPGPSKA